MARRRTGQDDEVPLYFGLTPNQVVAYNLAQARALKGWTQDQAAEALEPHLGARWSTASYSAAERSVDGNRIRNFDADEIVAFRSEEHTSELQSLMRISYAVFCLKKKKNTTTDQLNNIPKHIHST